MGSQRIVILTTLLFVIIGGMFFFRPKDTSTPLRLCTWSNYYPESILEEFTQKTGIRLELSYISSPEELLAKFKAGASGFDLIQPSDYLVRQMVKLNLLAPLNHLLLTNLHHLDEFHTNQPYDRGMRFSVPFTWGTTGISVNTDRVTIPPEGVTWKMLYDSPDPRHTSILDDMREVFGGALLWRGLSINTKDKSALERAKADIANAKNKILMFSPEPMGLLLKGEINIAHIFSTDGIQTQLRNPKIKYFIPKEGASLWTDTFAIPVKSKKVEEAHAFINYFLDPDNALKLVVQSHLASPNKDVRERLPPEEAENPGLYPPKAVRDKLEVLDDPGPILPLLNRMWTELKSS